MADHEGSLLPPPTNETLRVAARQFEYANRASVGGNYDLAIQCLRTSCKLVPTSLAYRQALRKAEKAKYAGNQRGSLLAPLSTFPSRVRLWFARRKKNYQKVLEHGEAILARRPWDVGAQVQMAEAAVALGLPVLAIWLLQQAREKRPRDVRVNRALARLLEEQGHFNQAICLWELVRQVAPHDVEAQTKAKQLAASETIARGSYEEAIADDTAGHAALSEGAGASEKTKEMSVGEKKKTTPRKKRASEEEELRARVEAEPSKPEPYLHLAHFYRRNGKLEAASAVLGEGLEAVGPVFELTLAQADLEVEPLRRSLAQNEAQLRLAPTDEKLKKAHETLLAQLNARELAHYRKKVDYEPLNQANHYELGVRLLRAGDVEEAIRELQGARPDPRLHWKAVVQLGHCFLAQQSWPLARRNFEEALHTIPAGEEGVRKEVLFQLAVGYAGAGDLDRGIELALDLANLDYSFRNIGRLLAEWQARAGAPRTGRPN
jgi:tetratricopeptide (TPR) repeat protein